MRLAAALLAALLTLAPEARAQLSGVYTVGGASPDYVTPADAFADLEASGVSGPVLLRVRYGIYTGQLTLGPVAGASATNAVVVRGEPDAGTGDLPVIEYGAASAADDWVLKLSGADHVTMETLRFQVPDPLTGLGNVVVANADFVEVRDCEIESVQWGQASGAATALRVTGAEPLIVGNTVTGGTRGIVVGGAATGQNARVRLNTVESDSLGILVQNQADPGGAGVVVRANTVLSSIVAQGFTGIAVRDASGAVEISRNRSQARDGVGIEIVDALGTPGAPVAVVNNMASAISNAHPALRLEGSTSVGVLHNSLYAFAAGSAAVEVASGSGVRIQNNIFVGYFGYTADIAAPAAISVLSDNVHSDAPGGNAFLARWNGTDHTTLAAWQAASGAAAGSREVDVEFVSTGTADLHLSGGSPGDRDLRAPPLAAVTVDLDGDPRDAAYPYVGADEDPASLAPPPPLNGIYLVRQDGLGDYVSFEEALDDLVDAGVSGPVQFSIVNGTYTEQVTIPPIAGVSASSPVTFLGIPVGSSTPRIRHAPTPEANWVLRIESDFVTFTDHEIENTGSDPAAGRAVHVLGDDVTLDGVDVIGHDAQSTPTTLLSPAAAVFIDDAARTTLTDCEIPRASVGIYADLGLGTDGPTVSDCAIPEPYNRAISISGGTGTRIEDVVVDQTASSALGGLAVAILLDQPQGAYVVRRNEVTLYDGDGVRVEGGSSLGGVSSGILANNLIAAVETGGGDYVPLTIRETDNLRVYHNTLYKSNSGAALVVDDVGGASSGLDVRNTIADGGEHAIDIADAAAISQMNHNVFQGGTFAYVVGGVSYASLDAYRAATGFDANSFEVDPDYVLLPFNKGTGDLRLDPAQGGGFAFGGTPLAAVPLDIDGTARSSTYPYIGGHELATPIAPFSGTVEISPTGGGDYTTLVAFLGDLETRGMDGPLTVELDGGFSYSAVLALGPIFGKSADNPLTFSGPASGPLPVLSGAGARAVLDDADHVTLRRLRMERTDAGAVVALEGSSDVVIEACELVSPFASGAVIDAVTGSGQVPNAVLTLRDNLISGGAEGFEIGFAPSSSAFVGTVVEGNTFVDQADRAVRLVRTYAIVEGNDITAAVGAGSDWVGIEVDYFGAEIGAGVQADMRVERNVIRGGEGTGILWLWANAQPPSLGDLRIANNTVRMTGAGETKGIDLSIPEALLVAHNTVVVTSPDTTSAALEVAFTFGQSQSVEVRNNLLQAIAGRALHRTDASNPATIGTSWNVMSTSGPTLVQWGASDFCPDAACYLALPFIDALFDSEGTATFADEASGDLHLAGPSVGDAALAVAALPEVPLDLDGETRGMPGTYAGADAAVASPVSPPPTKLPLAGLFTIDPSGGDFADFHEAVERLYQVGMGGHATFEASGGIYAGLIRMDKPIPGGSADSTVTFRSAPGETAVIEWDAYNEFVDFVWEMRGVSHVILDGLTLRALDAVYARGLWVYPRSFGSIDDLPEGIVVRNSRFEAPGVTDFVNYSTAIDAEATKGLRIEGSTFVDTQVRIQRYTTQAQHYPADTEIVGNTFEQNRVAYPAPAVHATEVEGFRAEGTRIDQLNPAQVCGSQNALIVSVRSGDVAVERNVILAPHRGLFLDLPFGVPAAPGTTVRAVNNTIWQPSFACQEAMRVEVPGSLVAHNAVFAQGPDAAVFIAPEASGGVDLRHNVIVSTDGPALDVDAAAVLTETSPNALWSDGAVLATWHGTDVADLAALQAASGGFAGSVETRPTFADEASGDLRLDVFDGDLVVAPLAEVPEDIDGVTRTDPTLMGVSHLTIPDLAVGVRALLQGAYPTAPTADGTPDPMRTALVGAGAVPLDHPYDDAAFDGLPAECDAPGVASGVIAADVVDWVVVALRTDPAGPDLACLPALLRDDGVVLGLDGTPGLTFAAMEAGDYHVVVYHRNHLAAMSAAPAALSETSTNVDLAGAALYGGGGLLVEPGLRALRSGDGDGDGTVLAPDQQTVWLPSVGQTGYLRGDFNLDGSVLANDQQVLWLPNVGVQSAVPGASSLSPEAPRE